MYSILLINYHLCNALSVLFSLHLMALAYNRVFCMEGVDILFSEFTVLKLDLVYTAIMPNTVCTSTCFTVCTFNFSLQS